MKIKLGLLSSSANILHIILGILNLNITIINFPRTNNVSELNLNHTVRRTNYKRV